MASVTQVRRLLSLLDKLRSDEAYNARQLAEQLGVSRRTMFRDLRSLEKLGVRAEFDERQQRYTVTMSEELSRAAEISPAELQSLIAFGQPDNSTDTDSETLASRLGLPHERDLGLASGEFRNAISQAVSQNKYAIVTAANGAEQQVAVIRLAQSAGCWFLIARNDELSSAVAIPLQKIVAFNSTNETFDRPSAAEMDQLTEQALRGSGTADEQASIRLRNHAAEAVTDEQFSSAYELEWLDDGSVTVQLPMANVDRTAQWVLGLGEQAEVIAPESLRREVARQVSQLYKQYS